LAYFVFKYFQVFQNRAADGRRDRNSRLDVFYKQSEPHPAADAERCQAALRTAFLHFVKQSGGNAHAGTADWMAKRNCASINV
jgi:hypothetical protein